MHVFSCCVFNGRTYRDGFVLDAHIWIECKMCRRDNDQLRPAIHAAKESKVSLLRIDRQLRTVIRAHAQCKRCRKIRCKFRTKGSKPSAVLQYFFTVDKHFRRKTDAFKFRIDAHPLPGRIRFYDAAIPAAATMIVVAAVLSVQRIPCMRNNDRISALRRNKTVGQLKMPSILQR